MFSRDILYSIFCHLDPLDLVGITLVCKQWNAVINSNPMIKQKFPFYPSELETGSIIPMVWGDDIMVIAPDTHKNINISAIWKSHIPEYPTLKKFSRIYHKTHHFIYPELYLYAAAWEVLNEPPKEYPYRLDLMEAVRMNKSFADYILGHKCLGDFIKLTAYQVRDLMVSLGIFRNTPRKAIIIPRLVSIIVDSNLWQRYRECITEEVLFCSYNDPHYEQDVLDFFVNYPEMVNWKDDSHDYPHGGGTVNPYRYMNSEFIQENPDLWDYYDWNKVLDLFDFPIPFKLNIMRWYF